MNIVLGNVDYKFHMTDEGLQLQDGLVNAGWRIVGRGYNPDETNVVKILEQIERPTLCFIQDARDWDKERESCFDHSVSYENIDALCAQPFPKIVVVKDAGSVVAYQQEFAQKVGASMAVTYYHDRSVLPLSPWLEPLTRIRTYHSIDAALFIRSYPSGSRSKRVLMSGALDPDVYPIRWKFYEAAYTGRRCIVEVLPHPGYGNAGSQVETYAKALREYRVHLATASRYGFALRKIIESVAIGCTPVTNLPVFDVLPEIDGALKRFPNHARYNEICHTIEEAIQAWDPDERLYWAKRAWTFYDWRAMGTRLSHRLTETHRRMEVRHT